MRKCFSMILFSSFLLLATQLLANYQREASIETIQEELAFQALEKLYSSKINRSDWVWERRKGSDIEVITLRSKEEGIMFQHKEFWFIKDSPILIGGGKVQLSTKALETSFQERKDIEARINALYKKLSTHYLRK